MKKTAGLLVVLFLLSIFYSIPANANSAKTCNISQVNLIKNGLVCTKSGTTYRWIDHKKSTKKTKVLRIKKQNATLFITPDAATVTTGLAPIELKTLEPQLLPQTTITQTLKSKPISIGQIALDNFIEWSNKNKSIKNNHFVTKNYDIPIEFFDIMSSTEKITADIFANFIYQDTYSFYGGEDVSWFYTHNKLVPPGNTNNICGTHDGSTAGCVNLIDSVFIRIPHDGFDVSYRRSVLAAHEYFHLVQSSIGDISPFVKRDIPRWFEEGTAEFVAHSSLSINLNKKYDDIFIEEDKKFKDIYTDPYVSGRILVEFIVKTYGFESIINIYLDYKNNKNFEYAFNKNIGKSSAEVLKDYKIGL